MQYPATLSSSKVLGMGRMVSATGNLEVVYNHLEIPFLILQMFYDDTEVLCYLSHLVVKALLQLPFLFFKCGG